MSKFRIPIAVANNKYCGMLFIFNRAIIVSTHAIIVERSRRRTTNDEKPNH